jgi:2,4-diketo-3-deoxy-L-fuconate hydrolase
MHGSTAFKLGTFSTAGCPPFPALVVEDRVLSLAAAASFARSEGLELTATDSMLRVLEDWSRNFPALQRTADAVQEGRLSSASASIGSLTFHPPVSLPRQIYCSGANYKKHVVQIVVAQVTAETGSMSAEERRAYGVKKMDERAAKGTPYFFLKAQSAVTGPFDPIVLPKDVKQPDWELELGVVIGKRARRVSREHALNYVAGYTIVNDITAREWVNRRKDDVPEMGMNWVPSKSSPTFLPMGPYLVPAAFVPDPRRLQLTLKLNGTVMQDESTADMIFDVARLIEALSAHCELLPGDLICTGSPAGNGMHYGRFLQPGDVMEGSITSLGVQRNVCAAEADVSEPK